MTTQIVNLTSASRQQFNVVGEDGDVVTILLYYLPTQNAWALDVTYEGGGFELRGILLTLSPNILRQYRNIIPFGLGVTSVDGYEPQFITDFSINRVTMYLLSATEVDEIEAGIYNEV